MMYEWIPQKTNNTARKLILLMFLGSAAIVIVTMLAPTIPAVWVFHLIAVFLLTAGIFLTTRYMTKMFIYRITEDGDLTVTEAAANGKRPCTVCRIRLSHIQERLLPQSFSESETLRKQCKKKKIKIYDYTVDYHPAESIFLIVREGGETLGIRLSYQETLAALLSPPASQENETQTE